jgi:hypothetical protein
LQSIDLLRKKERRNASHYSAEKIALTEKAESGESKKDREHPPNNFQRSAVLCESDMTSRYLIF